MGSDVADASACTATGGRASTRRSGCPAEVTSRAGGWSKGRGRVLLVAVISFQAVLFLTVARHRIIDGDEGVYLLASRLAFEHRVPYRDFFYHQMPLLPYIYGLWMQVAGFTWAAGRELSALLASALGTLLYVHVYAQTKKSGAALFAVALFVSNAYVVGWFTAVKTYALCALLVFIAYMLVDRVTRRSIALCGLSLGFGH
jgi:hypothetical protein